jgi:hypothetical protein
VDRHDHKIGYSAEAIDRPLVDPFIESHTTAPERIVLDLDATDVSLQFLARPTCESA